MTVYALGVVAKHIWTPSGGSAFTLNDRGAWPRYKVIPPIRGLRGLPDGDEVSEPNTELIGETIHTEIARGKTVTYSGRIFGRTWTETEQAILALLASFGPNVTSGRRTSGRMVITPHSSYSSHLETFTATCRAADCSEILPPSPTHTPSPFMAEFTIDLRLADPRLYDWNGSVASNAHW